MQDNEVAGAALPQGAPMEGRCPNCRKDGWTPAPLAVVAGLDVRPFVCDTCGFVALLHGSGKRAVSGE